MLLIAIYLKILLIATDMDGTLTHKGKFTPELMQALEDLDEANIQVIIVTCRSVGWVIPIPYKAA